MTIRADIATFLADHTPCAEDHVVWANGAMPLHITTYLADAIPPLDVILSVRCLVFSESSVLVLRDTDEQHIIPGGRREKGEALEETVRRELLEESGYEIGALNRLGFAHLHRLVPVPPDDVFPHDDFFWLIYWSEAGMHRPEARLDDPHELECGFDAIEAVQGYLMRYGQQMLLSAALKAREMTLNTPK